MAITHPAIMTMNHRILAIAMALLLGTLTRPAHASFEEGTSDSQHYDYGTMLKQLLPMAKDGNVQAQYLVGEMYRQGQGIERNIPEAVKWLRKSGESGNRQAMRALGRLYVQGQGVEQDFDEAEQWFRKARTGAVVSSDYIAQQSSINMRLKTNNGGFVSCSAEDPLMPKKAMQQGLVGVVNANAFVVDGVVEDVVILSGPKVFHDSVRKALLHYDCAKVRGAVVARQGFVFKIEDGELLTLYELTPHSPDHGLSPPPFNANWAGLSTLQKAAVKSQYVGLSHDDEPPYPIEGMGELLEGIRLLAAKLGLSGALRLNVKIGADGKVETVELLTAPASDFALQAAALVSQTVFKPARCNGSPCSMVIPIDVGIEAVKYAISRDALAKLMWDARDGDSKAQNELGQRFESGRGTDKDLERAFKWYRASALLGDASGQNNLGRMYARGLGTEKDLKLAADWYRKSAEQGHVPAQANYGYALVYGHGVAENATEGVSWLQKAADRGYAPALNSLGIMYQSGRGVARDHTTAFRLFEGAAKKDLVGAQFNLAIALATGVGTSQDLERYAFWIRQVAESGHAGGQNMLAIAYLLGLGVEPDLQEANLWLMKSAHQGDQAGQVNLAEAYQMGLGLPQDDAVALKWFLLAARQGERSAMYNLFKIYRDGRGADKDLKKAIAWLQQSAEKGYADAQVDLALAYETGVGVDADAVKATQWREKSEISLKRQIDSFKGPGMNKVMIEACRRNPAVAAERCAELIRQGSPR